jgi:hypothetical protein
MVFRLIFIGFAILYLSADHGNYNPNWIPMIYWPVLGLVYCLKCISLDGDIEESFNAPTFLLTSRLIKTAQSFCCLFLASAYYFRYAIIKLNVIFFIVGIPVSIFILVFYHKILFKGLLMPIPILCQIILLVSFVLLTCILTSKSDFLFVNVLKCFELKDLFGFNKYTIMFIIDLIGFEASAVTFFYASTVLEKRLITLLMSMGAR